MTKRALLNKIPGVNTGPTNTEGYFVLEVVNTETDQFEVSDDLEWVDCPDTVESFKYWYCISDSTFKKLEQAVDRPDDFNHDNPNYEWNWDTETWDSI